MKVIVAGFPKTGTKSMNAALTQLGYKVYDVVESFYMHGGDYAKIFNHGWVTEDFRRMYEDVDAVMDNPACHFWEEIHKAFPDAKIILMMRESDDVWYRSFKHQMDTNESNLALRMMEFLSPTYMNVMNVIFANMLINHGTRQSRWRTRLRLNEGLSKMKYRAHNAYVLNNAPKDKLLVYSCTEGWEPLCKFLEVPVPVGSFPRKNVQGNIVEELMKSHPLLLRLKREMLISTAALVFGTSIGSYLLYKFGCKGIYDYTCSLLNAWR